MEPRNHPRQRLKPVPPVQSDFIVIMSLQDNNNYLRIVLYEGDGAVAVAPEKRFASVNRLLNEGYALTRVTGAGRSAPAAEERVLVLGEFNDAPPFELQTERVSIRNISAQDDEEVLRTVELHRAETGAVQQGKWKPWFPVIDYDRCTNCMQCLSFCLFGVYGADAAGNIEVQTEDNCKTNCPACSRVCPEAAIMFPKYKAGPINGDEVSAADLQKEKMKVDISSLLGGDIYSMLRTRTERAQTRFSKERDSDKALKERQKCLVKLADAGDIPPEVLSSLPSPEEILSRAEAAKKRSQEALSRQQQNVESQ